MAQWRGSSRKLSVFKQLFHSQYNQPSSIECVTSQDNIESLKKTKKSWDCLPARIKDTLASYELTLYSPVALLDYKEELQDQYWKRAIPLPNDHIRLSWNEGSKCKCHGAERTL